MKGEEFYSEEGKKIRKEIILRESKIYREELRCRAIHNKNVIAVTLLSIGSVILAVALLFKL